MTGWAVAAATVVIAVGGIAGGGCTARSKHPEHAVLPVWARDEFRRLGLEERLEIHEKIDPAFQLGDFDGDGQLDVATLVRDRSSGKVGIVILHRAGGGHVLGAGRPFGNGGDDWNWLGSWKVIPGEQVPGGVAAGRSALLVEKPESAGGLVYWNGSEYVWVPWGD